MQRPSNLISDSSLVQETFDFIQSSGGRAQFSEITDAIFHLGNATPELAASLITDLIQNDPRFRANGIYLETKEDEIEDAPLNLVDFVVLDIEAASGKSVPTRIIEIGAVRVRNGEIAEHFEALVNPELHLPRFISALTGIT